MMVSALLVVTLPETNKAALKDTIEINERTPVISKKKMKRVYQTKHTRKMGTQQYDSNGPTTL